MKAYRYLFIPLFLSISSCTSMAPAEKFVPFEPEGISSKFLDHENQGFEKILGKKTAIRPIVVAAVNLSEPQYVAQIKTIQNGDIGIEEENQFIVIHALVQGAVPENQYKTSSKQAEALLQSSPFKILFYDSAGRLDLWKETPMKGPDILRELQKIK